MKEEELYIKDVRIPIPPEELVVNHAKTVEPPIPAVKLQSNKSRITVVEQVIHHRPGENPTSVMSRFSGLENTDEQPYERKVKVGTDWIPIESGWLNNKVAMLVISNDKPQLATIPEKTLQDYLDTLILEVSIVTQTIQPQQTKATPQNQRTMFSTPKEDEISLQEMITVVVPICEIPVGESCRFRPSDFSSLRIRCKNGEKKVAIYLYPK